MKGDKIDSKILDKLAGGVIVDDGLRISIADGVVTEIHDYGGSTMTYSVDDLRGNLKNCGFEPHQIEIVISMIESDGEFTIADTEKIRNYKKSD